MENNQSIQHELTQQKRPTAERNSTKSVVIGSYNVFIYLLTRHPLLLLTGLFTTLLGTTALALYNIAYVSDVEHVEAESLPAVTEEPITTNFEHGNPLPLWMVAAIALSCASGCWIIFRLLNQPIKDSQVQKRQATTNKVSFTQPHQPKQQLQSLKTQQVFATLQPLQPIIPIPSIKKPLITFLPPEQRNPFDESKESLSELLDWRKHNSLTAILQQYSS